MKSVFYIFSFSQQVLMKNSEVYTQVDDRDVISAFIREQIPTIFNLLKNLDFVLLFF